MTSFALLVTFVVSSCSCMATFATILLVRDARAWGGEVVKLVLDPKKNVSVGTINSAATAIGRRTTADHDDDGRMLSVVCCGV